MVSSSSVPLWEIERDPARDVLMVIASIDKSLSKNAGSSLEYQDLLLE
jgi:hypothetical protein